MSRQEDRAPDKPTELEGHHWKDVLKRTVKQFSEDKLTHWAAALTYYGVLSIFPGLLALISILGLIGQSATQPLLDNLAPITPGPARDILTNALNNLGSNQGGSTIAFIIGLGAAIWSASGYISAFMDASNAVWDVPEGRPIWKKLPLRIGLTVLLLVLITIAALAVVLTGPIAEQVGNLIGLGSTFLDVWAIAKWPVLALLVSFMISLLYWLAPNVKQPGFPWVTPGGVLAVVLWILASVLFAFYVSNFASYNKTYGSLGGVIVFLVWLWISNIVILLGAEFNSESERQRAIAKGHPADEEPYLPMRDEPKEKSREDTSGLSASESEKARTS
jgi:membrane protein